MELSIHDELIQFSRSSSQRVLGGVLTERDSKALQWIAEQGAMTVDQLWRAVWWKETAKESRYAYLRVSFLVRSGLLEKIKTPFYQQAHLRLTQLGHQCIAHKTSVVPTQKTLLQEVPHVHVLTELRLAVAKMNKAQSWVTDRMLAIDPTFPKERLDVTLPDALWITRESGRRIAIEYERTQKERSRVRHKVEALSREMARADRLFDLILWIAEPGAYQILKGLLVNHPNQRLRRLDQFLIELKDGTSS